MASDRAWLGRPKADKGVFSAIASSPPSRQVVDTRD